MKHRIKIENGSVIIEIESDDAIYLSAWLSKALEAMGYVPSIPYLKELA